MLRRITLTAVALLAAAPALAGGFSAPVVTPPVAPPPVVPVVVAPSTDWSGFYAGGQLGFGSFTTDFEFEGEEVEYFEGSGPLFGLHAGYLFDFGRMVAGVELDWDMTQIDVELGEDLAENAPPNLDLGTLDSIARLKGRVGFDAGRFMPYVTAGVARASFDFSDLVEAEFEADEEGDGRFVGLGASYMASDRLMVSLEALRHKFDDTPGLPGAEAEGVEVTTSFNSVTLRGSYRF